MRGCQCGVGGCGSRRYAQHLAEACEGAEAPAPSGVGAPGVGRGTLGLVSSSGANTSQSDAQANRLAELNVLQSLETLRQNATVKKAVAERGLEVHGVIYDIPAGELRALD